VPSWGASFAPRGIAYPNHKSPEAIPYTLTDFSRRCVFNNLLFHEKHFSASRLAAKHTKNLHFRNFMRP
jgi:hypothetical protein